MKKYILSALILATSLTTLSSNELSWVDEQVNAIKPSREGVSNYNIAILTDPFIFLEKNRPKKEDELDGKNVVQQKRAPVRVSSSSTRHKVYRKKASRSKKGFTLDAIMNSSALINGKWYKLNDKVKNYKLLSITKTSIVLARKSKKIVLSTHTKNTNLKFKSK